MTNFSFYTTTNSPVAEIILTSDGIYLTGLYIGNLSRDKIVKNYVYKHEIFNEIITQLNEYFLGKRQKFTIPIKQKGTEFQQLVWEKLQCVDYGKKTNYKILAELVGNVNASRAVGAANSKNRINIIVPCHRVILKNEEIGGYNCGADIKKWLLEHEQTFKISI